MREKENATFRSGFLVCYLLALRLQPESNFLFDYDCSTHQNFHVGGFIVYAIPNRTGSVCSFYVPDVLVLFEQLTVVIFVSVPSSNVLDKEPTGNYQLFSKK